MSSPAGCARIAALAALLASVADLLLLYVANAQRDELGLPPIGRAWLSLGSVLGIVAIPLYGLGYWAAARLLAPVSRRSAQIVFVAGAGGGFLGSVIHGLTAALIGAQLDVAAPGVAPLASLAAAGPLLLILWGLAALLVLVASAVFLRYVGRGDTLAPRRAALANPALLTIALASAGLPFDLLRSFLTPAAPNIAHLIFFLVCSRVPHEGARLSVNLLGDGIRRKEVPS